MREIGIFPRFSRDKFVPLQTKQRYSTRDISDEVFLTLFFRGFVPFLSLADFVSRDKNLQVTDLQRLKPCFGELVTATTSNHQQGSTSLIQRKFAIGYNRAGRIMDQLECAGIVGETSGIKAREVLCKDEGELEYRLNHLEKSRFEILKQKQEEELKEISQQEAQNENSRLIKLGIDLEKEGMINEAIAVYEKAIIPQLPATHPYDRLMILYRKKKDYDNEVRIIKIAIGVFMKENERRAGRIIEEDSSLYNQVMQALETNESIRYEDGKWAFVQYDVMEYITRLEKAKRLLEKSKSTTN